MIGAMSGITPRRRSRLRRELPSPPCTGRRRPAGGPGVKFQIRSASTEAGLGNAAWKGPSGEDSFYEQSGTALSGLAKDHGWLQYRAVLTSPDGGNSAILTEVAIQCGR